MKKILFWPYQVYVWLVFLPVVAVWTLVCGSLAVITSILISPRFGSRQVGARYARWIGYLTPIMVRRSGLEHVDEGRSYVVVCNHQSQYDIVVVYGWLKLDLKWVIKQELRKVPFIGIGCEKVGHIFVDRQRPERARAAINSALNRLGNGIGILFFPEGTRSDDGSLLRFKKGAFRVAIDQQLPVLPVTVSGTREILPARSLRLFPGTARMVVHPPIETDGMTVDDVPELMERARLAIASALPPAAGPS